jgi:integrase
MSKLNVTKIRSMTQPGKYGDGRNLWLIVGPTGRRRWEFRYTFRGRRREMSLGPTEFMSLDDARDRALELRKQLRAGIDPLEVKAVTAPRRITTFEAVADQAIASFEKGWTNAKAAKQWSSTLETYVYPKLGKMDVQAISTADVYDVLEPIWGTKTETASRVRARIERILDFATAMKLRTGENPARLKGNLDHLLAKRAKVQRVKHHDALPYEQIPTFMADLREREAVAARALEFAILTAARTSEVTGARWSEFDLDKATWTVPAERMKARRDHRVPLSANAVSLLKALPRDEKAEFVFISSMRAGEPMSNMAMTAVLKRMNRKEGVTVHGFRSTFRDWAAERTAYPDAVVEMALAHAVGNAVEAAYRRGDLFEKRQRLMVDWAGYCAGQAAGENVTPIRGSNAG